MFKNGDYVYYTVNEYRYVFRIIDQPLTKCYIVQVPMFMCWGSTFARWSKEKAITKKYLDRKCTLLPEHIADRYRNLKKNDPTTILFEE
jgi:hypothetical protein